MSNINIFGTLHNVTGEPIAKAAQIKDDTLNKTQAEINKIAIAGGVTEIHHVEYNANNAGVEEAAYAVGAGKIVVCLYSPNDGNYYYLICHKFDYNSGKMYFSGIFNNTLYYCDATPDEGWSKVSTLSLSDGGTEMVDVGSDNLPIACASTMNKLYLKDSSNPNTNNIKEEWVTIAYRAVTYNNKEYKVIDKGIAEGEYDTEHIEPGTYDGEILLHPSREFSGASWDANGVCYGTDLVEEWVEDNKGWESVELRLGDSYTIRGGFTVVATTSGWTVIDEVPTTYVWELTGGSIKKGNFDTFDVTLPTFPDNTGVELTETQAKAMFNVSTLAELFSVVGAKITQGYFAKVSYTDDNVTQTSICNCYVLGDITGGRIIVVGELYGRPINIMVRVNDSNFGRCVIQTSPAIQPLSAVALSGSYNDLSNKPTIDNTPKQNSNNLVKSGGVYSAIYPTGGISTNRLENSAQVAIGKAADIYYADVSVSEILANPLTSDTKVKLEAMRNEANNQQAKILMLPCNSANSYGYLDYTYVQATIITYGSTFVMFFYYNNEFITVTGSPSGTEWSVARVSVNQIQSDWNQTDNSAKDFIKNKPEVQTKLVSGTNIKSINGQSLLDLTNTTDVAVQPLCHFGEVLASDSPLFTKPNRYFKLTGQVGTLQIVLREPTVESTDVKETYVYFTTGSNPNITYISQAGLPILADSRFQIIPNTTYELKFTYNGTSWTVTELELTTTLYAPQT